MAAALRLLAFRLTKALPLRVPAASRAFATAPKPKGDPSSKISAEFYRPTTYSSYDEMVEIGLPRLRQKFRLSWEEDQRRKLLNERIMALTAVGGLGSMFFVASIVRPKTK
ncbi:hypothetical protein U9M48_011708 [Paspalum notatum var. saurae]|uniref:Uncharacterized protein n=1 Tax=Paspalum notatum var. saurae TaxID=547442 RepID=A0AAQ3WHT7_PASNO